MINGGRRAIVVCAVVALVTAGCTRDQEATPANKAADYAEELQSKVTVDATMAHLQKLQEIADTNGGTRVAGSPGYDASVDYVAETLRDKGFDVETPEFTMGLFNVGNESLSVNGKPVEAHVIDFSGASPAQGATGRFVAAPADDDPGCTASDYDGLDVAGAVVLVDRGACFLFEKAVAATERGAVALVVANDVEEEAFSGGMSEEDAITIPVLSVTKADGARLRSQTGTATVVADTSVDQVTTRNVIAQTKTGATDNVVMVGAHLDSVRQGPGINDNGTGVATVLETALQMGPSPEVTNAVRFGFWGGEEEGLLGSHAYVQSLDIEALKDIALYLNFDMMASPNTCYFTSDADQSLPPDPELDYDLLIPEGSPGVERTLVDTIESAGKTSQDLPFDGRSDYDSFSLAGIPAGNFDTGADEIKTPEQVTLWGGIADEPCDPNYHSAADTIENVNRDALALNGGVIGHVVGLYAQDEGGRNGVPAREDRTRHLLPDE
ncbi:M28 family peptidase [Mycolicibacterium sp. CR10]|uniref:M28 family peptidase n=1 Tax=Mycolicibacterium sp. CR10 TaxID=2562314 RepID=UPI0010BFF490|nr:M28 family peptidase [Mycolicibacterium sp. CR10]